MTTLHLRKSIILLIALALACFAPWPVPKAFGVSPAPDGAYSGANTAEGQNALFSLTSGIHNTALGYQTLFSDNTGHDNMASGFLALFKNTTGSNNTANGAQALYSNTTGGLNTAGGFQALYKNTTGRDNTADGYGALYNNNADANTAVGFQALFSNTVGTHNTGVGFQALFSNHAFDNTAVGWHALQKNTTSTQDTAVGSQALASNTTGVSNTANGALALYSNTTGGNNTANGASALSNNTTGGANTADGDGALANNTIGSENVAFGVNALIFSTSGNNNIALGVNAGSNLTTGHNNIDIGNVGVADEANAIRIGNPAVQRATFIAGIRGTTTGNGDAITVVIDSAGQLGTMSSSRRFKKEIRPMDQTSQAILGLQPVTFQYKSDSKGTPQFGLIAEEVAQVDPDLVVRDAQGEIYSVRYDAVNAMLLNEFLKEHQKVEQLTKDFESKLAEQQKQIKALASGLERVSAQVEMSRTAPQTALNNQ
jgi:trimeric autotransporter adhesin